MSELLRPLVLSAGLNPPAAFPDPLSNQPHPIAKAAALDLQTRLPSPSGKGLRFSVLVVETDMGWAYLSAFHDQWLGQWQHEGFVPPGFDHHAYDGYKRDLDELQQDFESRQSTLKQVLNIDTLRQQATQQRVHADTAYALLKQAHAQRKQHRQHQRQAIKLSDDGLMETLAKQSRDDRYSLKLAQQHLEAPVSALKAQWESAQAQVDALEKTFQRQQRQIIKQRNACLDIDSFDAQTRSLDSFFNQRFQPISAGLSGACKLLRYAQQHAITPIALAEFWWGLSPKNEVRYHKRFYPCARGSDGQLLPFMLQGIRCAPAVNFCSEFSSGALATVHEDEHILVIDKPSGMLSTPGANSKDSVQQRIQKRLPDACGPLLLHRLDLATSGLLLIAKDKKSHKHLQQQFIQRKVEKRYLAVLNGELAQDNGVVDLPIRVDLDDRPRQVVCDIWGKSAITKWEVLARKNGQTHVHFSPVTGRTHQLRLHSAHSRGLNCAIVGDVLYGYPQKRLMLHAEQLCITHPVSGDSLTFIAAAPF